MNKKSDVARLSILSNTILIVLKLVVGLMTGAVSIISEAIHSLMDLAASAIAYFAVRFSDKPPDLDHPYGHEKVENISGVVEAVLIIVASFFIVKQAVHKLLYHSAVESIGLGFGVMAISAIVNWIVSRKLYKVARSEESVALEADALHLKTDVYTSLGVAAGLGILWITGLNALDPIVAILIALFILKEAYGMLVRAFGPLIDTKLSDEDIEAVNQVMEKYRTVFVDFHELRTRRAGKIKHIDLHLTTPQKMTIKEFHDYCDVIEKDIEQKIKNTKVLIHAEPCDDNCTICTKVRDCNDSNKP
jgi:cation diffusion facilitator family transporter